MAEQWDLYDQDGRLRFAVTGTQKRAQAYAEMQEDALNTILEQEGKPRSVRLSVHFRVPSETREPEDGWDGED